MVSAPQLALPVGMISKVLLYEGDMGVYGNAVLGFFSCGISVILILTCGIVVSSSSAVCGFSSFWRPSIKPGTWNIPEHSGTSRKIPEHEKIKIFFYEKMIN